MDGLVSDPWIPTLIETPVGTLGLSFEGLEIYGRNIRGMAVEWAYVALIIYNNLSYIRL